MKRILIVVSIIIMLFALCACGAGKAPSAAALKKIIPQDVDIDLDDYPLLLEMPPTADEILGDTPRTFVFDEKEWSPTESELEEYGYEVYSGADGTTLQYLPDPGYYQILRGTMNPDTSVSEDFLWIEYDENGDLFVYRDAKYGCVRHEETISSYEGDELTETESFICFDLEVRDGDCEYRYSTEARSGEITQIQVEQIKLTDPNRYDYLSFCYDPESGELDYITKQGSTRSGHYMCEYDPDGTLRTVTYYLNEGRDISYVYDGNYKLIETEELS